MKVNTEAKPKMPSAIMDAVFAMIAPYKTDELLAKLEQTAVPVPERTRPYTRREVAELMGVSLQSVNRWMNAGLLKKIRIGKRAVRIDALGVHALMNNGISITPAAVPEVQR